MTTTANTKAGKDGDGNTISSTYLKKSGGTITGDINTRSTGAGFRVSNSTYDLELMVGPTYCGIWNAKKGTNGDWMLRADSNQNGLFYGNASTASKLATARTIRTDLSSTTAVGFDGSANITPGVTGTLPIARGGTGNTGGHATYTSKGSRTTNGTWTISSLVVGIPLFILHRNNTGSEGTCDLRVTAGATTGASKGLYKLGYDRTDCFIVIPTSTSVSISCSNLTDDSDVLYAYQ